MRVDRAAMLLLAAAILGGCASSPPPVQDRAPTNAGKRDFSRIPDAVPRAEPKSRGGNPASYVVLGKRYQVLDSSEGFVQRGVASWYGSKFHGRLTSNGEVYDMYQMTAAHKTLPIPTYVQVTNLFTNRSVVVRVNDRGPFHDDRIIDLSYAAARKLGITGDGTALVEVRAIDPTRPEPRPVLAVEAPPVEAPPVEASPVEASPVEASPVEASPVETSPEPAGAAATVEAQPAQLAAAEAPPAREPVPAASAPPLITSQRYFLQVGAFSDRQNAERIREKVGTLAPAIIDAAEGLASPVYRVRLGPFDSHDSASALIEQVAQFGVSSPRVVGVEGPL